MTRIEQHARLAAAVASYQSGASWAEVARQHGYASADSARVACSLHLGGAPDRDAGAVRSSGWRMQVIYDRLVAGESVDHLWPGAYCSRRSCLTSVAQWAKRTGKVWPV